MKVLHVTPSFLPVVGGAEINLNYLAKFSKKQGIDPIILTFNMNKRWSPKVEKNEVKFENINVIKWPGLRPYPNIKFIRGILPKFLGARIIPGPTIRELFRSVDIIHFHDEVDLSFPISALMIDVPKIMHIRTLNVLFDKFKKSILRRLILSKIADLYICNSTTTAKALMNLGIEKNKIDVIPNGVDPTIFSYNNKQSRKKRQLLFVGRMQKEKGLHVILEALKTIFPPIELFIVVGAITDSNYYEQQKKKTIEINKEFGHKFVWKYSATHKELASLYQESTVFICPSFKEAFGNVNIEAMACGAPVIATMSGGPIHNV